MSKIKNIENIRAKAKKQIMDLLDYMKCYRYTEEGIDLWLNTWEKGCEKQITEIAEKHEFYDGDCKIVFPAEYPRDIDKYQIGAFANWLYGYAGRNAKESTYNGFTLREAVDIVDFKRFLVGFKDYADAVKALPLTLQDAFHNLMSVINGNDIQQYLRDALEAKRELYSYDKYIVIGSKSIELGYYNDIAEVPIKLGQFLDGCKDNASQFLTRNDALDLKELFPECRFSEGQKLSRAVSLIGRKYNLTSDPDWNKEYSDFADAVNPLTVVRWTVLSWHPIDYLTFCFGDTWSSCCTIDRDNVRGKVITKSRSSITNYIDSDSYAFRGEHSAAALSYMFDNSSFIYYTVSDKYKGNLYEEQDKKSRIVFSLSDDMTTLLQTRLYPQCNDDSPNDTPYKIPREIVQKVICDSIGVPNLWTVKKGTRACIKYAISSGVHYADYKDERNKHCNISYRGDEPTTIYIGHNAICPECGRTHDYIGSLNCVDCDPYF